MTYLEVTYRYGSTPTEDAMRALDGVREVYGILSIRFDDKQRSATVRFDASRFKEEVVSGLLRNAGLDIREKLTPA
jgi:hypothetical protein